MSEPLGRTERLQAVRDGVAEGRDMGMWREVVDVIDAINALRGTDQAIIDGVKGLAESARDAITSLRTDATTEFAAVRAEGATAITSVRADTTTAINTLNTNTATAIGADRARLSVLEQAVVAPTTGINARLAKLEARLTAAGIA